MKPITRRTFIQTTAAAAGAAAVTGFIPNALVAPAFGEGGGYFQSEFGITDACCEKVLAQALSKGGDFADLYFEYTVNNYLVLEDGKVNSAYAIIDLGVGIRTVNGDQTGYAFTQELTENSMLEAAGTAATIASGGKPNVAPVFVALKTKNYYPLSKLWTDVPLQSRLPWVNGLNEKCFALDKAIIKVRAIFNDEQKRCYTVTSDGVKFEDLLPKNFLAASVVAQKGDKMEQGSYNLGGRREYSYYTDKVVDEIAKKAVGRAMILFDAVQPPAGEMPVVLAPGIPGILLHEAIGHGMEADFNRKKVSTYSTMLNKPVAKPFVNIVDDATNMRLNGSLNADDEGTPGQRTMLVENGILTSYLHDKISSKYYGVKPTGNGRRQSYKHMVIPRMRNTYMLNGPNTPDEIIKSVKKGIYCKDISNGQVNIGEGDFAFYVTNGSLIEDGKLTAPIKDINIMGNGPKILENVLMVGNDLELYQGGGGYCGKDGQRVPVGFGLPTLLVESMTVGGVKA